MSAWDFEATNAFGTKGAIAFPGVDGYSRNLWDTTYDNWGPRVGAAYSVNDRTVLRGGFGITYLPSNTGYFSGPTDYGSANFSAGVTQTAYGTTPRGVPVIRFSDPAPIAPAIGGDPTAPQVYGIGEARFDRHFKNGQARQWNLFIERSLFKNWMASIGYTASVSRNLFNRSYPIQNLQSIPADTLAQWRDQYIASNGTLNPSTQLVPNPFQPASGPLLPFAGALGAATIARQNTLFPYPLLIGSNAAVDRSGATADYHAMVLRVSRRFAGGVMMDATYTWSKEIDNTDNMEDNQNFNAGGGARGNNHSLTDPALNRRLGYSDVPHRLVGTFLYDLPFGKGQSLEAPSAWLRAIVGGWQLGGALIWQTGFPIAVTGASDGAALTRPDRVDGVPTGAAREPVGLVRRTDAGDAPERTRDHAAGADLPQIQSGCVCRPRRDHAERPHRRGSILVRQRGDHVRRVPDRQPLQHRPEHPPGIRHRQWRAARVRRGRHERAEPHAVQRRIHWRARRNRDHGEPGARPRARHGQLEQLRHAGDGHVQPAADSAADVAEVLKRCQLATSDLQRAQGESHDAFE